MISLNGVKNPEPYSRKCLLDETRAPQGTYIHNFNNFQSFIFSRLNTNILSQDLIVQFKVRQIRNITSPTTYNTFEEILYGELHPEDLGPRKNLS